MSLFKLTFIRKFLRRYTKPIPEDNATKWKRRLAVGYMIMAWNAFGLVCYQIYIGKADWARYHGLKTEEELKLSAAQQWAKVLGIKKAEVIKISGFDVAHYQINNEDSQSSELQT